MITDEKLSSYKNSISSISGTLIRLEERKKTLENQLAKAIDELGTHGINIEGMDDYLNNAETEMNKLESEIISEISTINSILNEVNNDR